LLYDFSRNDIPDLEELRGYFQANIDAILRKTMISAIACSRLDLVQKTLLLQKQYDDGVYWHLFYIAKKHKLLGILKWLQERSCNIEKEDKRARYYELPMGSATFEYPVQRVCLADDCPF
jgi:hypothetical protein